MSAKVTKVAGLAVSLGAILCLGGCFSSKANTVPKSSSSSSVKVAKVHHVARFKAGTTINGIDVSHLTVGQAVTKLHNSLGKTTVTLQKDHYISGNYVIKNVGEHRYQINKASVQDLLKSNKKGDGQPTYNLPDNAGYPDYVKQELNSLGINNKRSGFQAGSIKKQDNKFNITAPTYSNMIDLVKLQSAIVADNGQTKVYSLDQFYTTNPSNVMSKDQLDAEGQKIAGLVHPIKVSVPDGSTKSISGQDVYNALTLTNNQVGVDNSVLVSLYHSLGLDGVKHTDKTDNTITTPDGQQESYDKGTTGWQLSESDFVSKARQAILNNSNNITLAKQNFGTSKPVDYVAVNLNSLQEYVVRNGNVAVQTSVMTGNDTKGDGTPTGTFHIQGKQSPSHLRGTNDDGSKYDVPVNYWVPFDGTVGLHDSSWQASTTYGNKGIRAEHGSHGCVNTPPSVMGQVYNNVYVGMTVYVYNK